MIHHTSSPTIGTTARQQAVDAAELCQNAQHFALYPDTARELTEAHVNAHQTESAGDQPCATCGLAIEPAPGNNPSWHSGYMHTDRESFIRHWPAHAATLARPFLVVIDEVAAVLNEHQADNGRWVQAGVITYRTRTNRAWRTRPTRRWLRGLA